LKMKQDGRIMRLLAHAFNVQRKYASRLPGKIARGFTNISRKIPFGPLKWPFLAMGFLWQGMLMLFTHREIDKSVPLRRTGAK